MIPKLNDVPKYDVTIPSTGQKVRFRPYLVREERILLGAYESGEADFIVKTIVDTISACIVDEVNTNRLTQFDVEYLFTKIRAKSVGETIPLGITCEKCEEETQINVNIDKVDMPVSELVKTIQLTDTISVDMKYPSWSYAIDEKDLKKVSSYDSIVNKVLKCIESINTEEERIVVKDEPVEELMEFVESLTKTQFLLLKEFVDNMPKFYYKTSFDCVYCSHHNEIQIEDIETFF